MLVNELKINNRYAILQQAEIDGITQKEYEDIKPEATKYVLPSSTFLNQLSKSFKHHSITRDFLVPPKCRYLYEDVRGRKIVVIEDPPAVRTILTTRNFSRDIDYLKQNDLLEEWGYKNFENSADSNGHYKFTLAFPFVIYVIAIREKNQYMGGRIFFSPAPVIGMSDKIYLAPLTNISDRQYICMGDGMGGGSQNDITTLTQNFQHYFWNNAYNNDYTNNTGKYFNAKVPYVSTWFEWEHHTKEDPSFIFKVKWIPAKFKSIKSMIERTCRDYGIGFHMNESTFSDLQRIFQNRIHSNEEDPEKPKATLIENAANMLALDKMGNYSLYAGDVFIYKDQEVRVLSLLSMTEGGVVTHARIECQDGTYKILRLLTAVKRIIIEQIKEKTEVEEITLKGKTKIKVGDIVVLTTKRKAKRYYKVGAIRNFNGKIEIRLGNLHYILENISLEKFKIDKLKINGTKIDEEKVYMATQDAPGSRFIRAFKELTYKGHDISPMGSLTYRFTLAKTGIMDQINPNDKNINFIDVKKLKKTNKPFRIINKIYGVRSSSVNQSTLDKATAYFDEFGALISSVERIRRPDFSDISKKLIDNKNGKFKIESFDYDINFEVGDRIVVANWDKPLEMLKVRMLMGFKVNNSSGVISIVAQDKNEKLSEHPYITKDRQIFVNTIRKISNEYNGLTTGMKIKAKEADIENFPKKDVNIIVGFITDTGGDIPMVLCSNGLTLWADDVLEKFRKIKTTSPQWKKLKHTQIDMSQVKLQPGDMFEMTDGSFRNMNGYILFDEPDAKRAASYPYRCLTLDTIQEYYDYFIFDETFNAVAKPYGFLAPRYSKEQIESFDKISCFPNCHGMFKGNSTGKFLFSIDPRRII